MSGQVRHLLSRNRVVDGDDLCITGSSEILVGRAESDSSYGLDKSAERVGHLARGVVEDVDAAVLVARSGHLTIGRLSRMVNTVLEAPE